MTPAVALYGCLFLFFALFFSCQAEARKLGPPPTTLPSDSTYLTLVSRHNSSPEQRWALLYTPNDCRMWRYFPQVGDFTQVVLPLLGDRDVTWYQTGQDPELIIFKGMQMVERRKIGPRSKENYTMLDLVDLLRQHGIGTSSNLPSNQQLIQRQKGCETCRRGKITNILSSDEL